MMELIDSLCVREKRIQGLYFQGTGENLKSENFAFEAQKYNDKMIIAAPQLDDWGETSANKTVELVRFLMEYYNIDSSKIYANGYSGGGETMSLVLEKAPELFTAYLHGSSKWDGCSHRESRGESFL